MDEQPKSIWQKSLRLPQIFLVWLGLMVATMLIFVVTMLVINEPFTKSHEVLGLLVFGAVSATVLLAGWLFIRWLCCWRNIKRSLFALACLATLIALFYAEENWRGQRAWDHFRREWEAKGEKFDFKDFVPPPVPDEQNFAMTPVVSTSYSWILSHDGKKIPNELRDTNIVNRLTFDLGDRDLATNGLGYWVKGTVTDLRWRQEHYRELATKTNLFPVPPQPTTPAADVLLALSKFDGTVEELRQASLLPQGRFPLEYDNECLAAILLPHLAALKQSSQLLQWRAVAELQHGQSELALADTLLTLRLVSLIRSEPTLIGHLVRIAMTDISLQPVYEGLAAHQWTEAQLLMLNAELAKLDFLTDNNFCLRSERAFALSTVDYVQKKNTFQRYQELFDTRWDDDGNYKNEKKTLQAAGVGLMPSGWFDRNKLLIAQLHQQWLLRVVEPEKQLVRPRIANENPLAGVAPNPMNIFATEMIPSLNNVFKKFTREQISVDLARTAIALERYRLAHGEFPENLAVLEPQFIAQVPHDIIGGGPLKYRREADGTFTLYSIGWNEKDDGGVTVYQKGRSLPEFESGDWVWRYPVKD
jgi:hypothetical protein